MVLALNDGYLVPGEPAPRRHDLRGEGGRFCTSPLTVWKRKEAEDLGLPKAETPTWAAAHVGKDVWGMVFTATPLTKGEKRQVREALGLPGCPVKFSVDGLWSLEGDQSGEVNGVQWAYWPPTGLL
ncbi:hypothetical protein [Bacteriophage sp.]|nr:hypothetical protein [Bacteriophage sp.]UOF80107.1 hypothetical protein [Bacteriophage sp.]